MSEEKPLHVRVAEALGAKACFQASEDDGLQGMHWLQSWREFSSPGDWLMPDGQAWKAVPRYDTDWSATGPLIERFQFDVSYVPSRKRQSAEDWSAVAWVPCKPEPIETVHAYGPTPLEAVCRLILALHEAGKLKAA